MDSGIGSADRYARLVALNAEAFGDGQYEEAFHALTAALHCAIALGDEGRLRTVERLAAQQEGHIDRHPPSGPPAVVRGVQSAYGTLVRQASRRPSWPHRGR